MRGSSLLLLIRCKRVFIPLVLFTTLTLWTQSDSTAPRQPSFEVFDFHIKGHQAQDEGYREGPQRLNPQTTLPSAESPATVHEKLTHHDLKNELRTFIQWNRPETDHWPAWHDYDATNYDPNRWEALDRQYGYFFNSTVHDLESQNVRPEPFLPYPEYNSDEWRQRWIGDYVPCHGPAGETFFGEDADHLVVQGYRIPHNTYLKETVGSSDALELIRDTCFDKYSRYHAYGMDDADTKSSPDITLAARLVIWEKVKWGWLQRLCLEKNLNRYNPLTCADCTVKLDQTLPFQHDVTPVIGNDTEAPTGLRQHQARTAILIRTWGGYEYKQNDLQAIRALITETSLISGGEYQVFLLVNIKEKKADIYSNRSVYEDLLEKSVPKEFRDIAILWTEKVLEQWYPKVGDWQVYWQQFMSLQWFSKHRPEFDHVWNWEIDARYIGNHYHFLEQVGKFARKTPRKHLWERNSRFYFPELWGDNYTVFLQDTDRQILDAAVPSVWGPRPYAPFQSVLGPLPPRSAQEDDFEWGVGEEADLITLQPIWDPSQTGWSYRNHIWNFIPEVRPKFTADNPNHDGFDHLGFHTIPRRVFINTVARFSKRLLHVMHMENLEGRSMQAEMWPATVALHHGLKAVYAPHPIWTDRVWPA